MIALILAGQIYFSDADSGRLASGEAFRLHGIDAPETWKPECEVERAAGYAAKAAAIERTRGQRITVTARYGVDRYGRAVVDIEARGSDLGAWLVAQGHAQHWRYDDGDAKPDWCD